MNRESWRCTRLSPVSRIGTSLALRSLIACTLKNWHFPARIANGRAAAFGPTNKAVSEGIAGIWKAEPAIKIEIIDVYTCGDAPSCVANITVIVNESTSIKVCDVISYDTEGKVVSLVAYKV